MDYVGNALFWVPPFYNFYNGFWSLQLSYSTASNFKGLRPYEKGLRSDFKPRSAHTGGTQIKISPIPRAPDTCIHHWSRRCAGLLPHRRAHSSLRSTTSPSCPHCFLFLVLLQPFKHPIRVQTNFDHRILAWTSSTKKASLCLSQGSVEEWVVMLSPILHYCLFAIVSCSGVHGKGLLSACWL